MQGKHAENQDHAAQQTVERLRAVASRFVEEEGEHAQLEFLVHTSAQGRFQVQSFPGEPVKDLLNRIAYVALMPDHGGLESASGRKVGGATLCGTGNTSSASSASESTSNTCGSRRSSISSVAIASDCDGSVSTVTHSEDKSVVRFSESVERIIFCVGQIGKDKPCKGKRMRQPVLAPKPNSTAPASALPMHCY